MVINFDDSTTINIMIEFINIEIGMIDENKSFVLYCLFDINLEIIVGYENTAIVDNNDIVGESKL